MQCICIFALTMETRTVPRLHHINCVNLERTLPTYKPEFGAQYFALPVLEKLLLIPIP
jgi:hypothetical protein